MAINPITFTRDETLATAEQYLGSIALNKDGSVVIDKDGKIAPVKNYADVQVNIARGVVICTITDVEKLTPGTVFSGKGVFHTFDYTFYYFNIRENVANRTKTFLNK